MGTCRAAGCRKASPGFRVEAWLWLALPLLLLLLRLVAFFGCCTGWLAWLRLALPLLLLLALVLFGCCTGWLLSWLWLQVSKKHLCSLARLV